MRALLIQPLFPITYWGFQYGLSLAGRKVSLPPLGLISLAALLPDDWELRLLDLNAESLDDEHLAWADVVLVGGMHIQGDSMRAALTRARRSGCLAVAGGPGPTTAPEDYPDVDILFSGEAEGRIDELLRAIAAHTGSRQVLERTGERPQLSEVPIPRLDLLKLEFYGSISLQYSRGCPFQCEFCDIIEIFGRKPRVKSAEQMLAEFETLRRLGYQGSVFVVDDNFIGHKPAVKAMLPKVAEWQASHGHPFELYTEASVNLAADAELLEGMVAAGFSAVFLGIETPSETSLSEAKKNQNLRMDLTESVDRVTRAGLEVLGGFIVGFDNDGPEIFEQQRQFINSNPIPCAMVGILSALPGTALWRRMEREGRLRLGWTGDQLARPNFVPAMDERALLEGYKGLVEDVYSPQAYYRRCRQFLQSAPKAVSRRRFVLGEIPIALRTGIACGVRAPWRKEFWGLMRTVVLHNPRSLGWAVAHAIWGEHLIRYTRDDLVPRIEEALAGDLRALPSVPKARPRKHLPVTQGRPLATATVPSA